MPAELVPAGPEQQPILANLLELYAHDFSEFHPIELGADGRYGYQQLPLYWSEPDRYPFLVKVDTNLSGFVLVKKAPAVSGENPAWDMAEFFIVRAYRRQGIGMHLAHQVWTRFPGPWQVRVMEANRSGVNFWQRAIAAFIGESIQPARIQKDGRHWHVFTFQSGPYSTLT